MLRDCSVRPCGLPQYRFTIVHVYGRLTLPPMHIPSLPSNLRALNVRPLLFTSTCCGIAGEEVAVAWRLFPEMSFHVMPDTAFGAEASRSSTNPSRRFEGSWSAADTTDTDSASMAPRQTTAARATLSHARARRVAHGRCVLRGRASAASAPRSCITLMCL